MESKRVYRTEPNGWTTNRRLGQPTFLPADSSRRYGPLILAGNEIMEPRA